MAKAIYTAEASVTADLVSRPELILPANDTLFTSGTLGRYSQTLNSVIESRAGDKARAVAQLR